MGKSAFIYDAVRTPRGKGRKDGSLYEVKPIDLLSGLLKALENRNRLDTARVDDVVMGCNAPIGDQGSNIPRIATLKAGWDESVCGVQMERFCGSALESVATAASKIMNGWKGLGFDAKSTVYCFGHYRCGTDHHVDRSWTCHTKSSGYCRYDN